MSIIGLAESAATAGTPWGCIRVGFKLLPWVGAAGLGLWVSLDQAALARKNAALQHATDVMQINRTRIEQAMTVQQAADLAHARQVERLQDQANQEVSGDLSRDLARAQSLAAAYARRLRDAYQAAHGGLGGTGQPGAANAPSGATGAGDVPIMDDDDFRVCTTNTIKAIGWRAWWAKVSAIPR